MRASLFFTPFSALILLVCGAFQAQAFSPQDEQASQTPSSPTTQSAPDSRDANVYGANGTNKDFLKQLGSNVLQDQKAIWTSPFHIKRSNAKWWLITGAITAELLVADHPIARALPMTGPSSTFGADASRAGQWYSVFPAAGALFALGWVSHDDKLRDTGAESLEALIDADITVNVVKVIARRQRPRDGDGGGHFEKGGASFYSGHSTQAWAIASVIADEYGDHKWVPILSYGYATLISTSRVLAEEHFTSDVFVGAAIGFFIGRYVVHTQRMHREHSGKFRSKLLTPVISPDFMSEDKAVSLSWSY